MFFFFFAVVLFLPVNVKHSSDAFMGTTFKFQAGYIPRSLVSCCCSLVEKKGICSSRVGLKSRAMHSDKDRKAVR